MKFLNIFKQKTKNPDRYVHSGCENEYGASEDPEKREKMVKSMSSDNDVLYQQSLDRSLLYGAIIGDIVGSKYEFNHIKTKEFPMFSDGCSYTDDSIMTIAVANAIENSWNDKEKFARALISEMQRLGRKYPRPQGGYGERFNKWLQSEKPQPYNSFGNGSAMRVSACAIYAVELEEALELAEISASVTHNHPEGIKGAKAVAAAIFLAKGKRSKEEIREYIERHFYPLKETVDEIRLYYSYDDTCQGTVPQAIIAFLESNSFEDAIRNAVSIGGDTDTVAAITGSIAWAFYLDPYTDAFDAVIAQANAYLPQEFIDAILLFGKKSLARFSSYHRMTDSSGFTIVHRSRVGKDHSDTRAEIRSRFAVKKWITLAKIKDNKITPNSSAEYYCIAADGTVFKKEHNGFYRLDLDKMMWTKDKALIRIWNGEGPVFQEFRDFEDYFPNA